MRTVTINYYLVNGMTGRKVWGKNQKEIKAKFPEIKNEKLMKVDSEKWQIGDDEKIVCASNGMPKAVSINA